MGDIPNLTPEQIEAEIDGVSDVQPVGHGGQKSVFSGLINGRRFALKFLKAPGDELDSDDTEFDYTPDMVVRAISGFIDQIGGANQFSCVHSGNFSQSSQIARKNHCGIV